MVQLMNMLRPVHTPTLLLSCARQSACSLASAFRIYSSRPMYREYSRTRMAEASEPPDDRTVDRPPPLQAIAEINLTQVGDTGSSCTMEPNDEEKNVVMEDGITNKPETDTDEGATAKAEKTRKSFKSSVCIIPPNSVWDQIQDIRRVHDKSFERWMPHINMMFPFLPDYETHFVDAAERIQNGLAKIPATQIAFTKDSFGFFKHKKYATLWLKPLVLEKDRDTDHHISKESSKSDNAVKAEPSIASGSNRTIEHHPVVLEIQSKLEDLFPSFRELSTKSDAGFQPHLSLGQFANKEVVKKMAVIQENWQDIVFELKEVCLISRADFDDPFHLRHAVPLGSQL